MIREIEDTFVKANEKMEKVLVCITAQCNSKRLISAGAKVADENNAQLHILHVLQGNSIFNNESTPKLLEEIFDYGTSIGGMIHCICNDDVVEGIETFVSTNNISRVILGEPPVKNNVNQEEIKHKIGERIDRINPDLEVIIVKKENSGEAIIISNPKLQTA
ncbi:MAG: hypothetical protein ACRCW1_10255 [Anaerotignaceae bacterium]